MTLGAWGSFDGDTKIGYTPCAGGAVEIMIGGDGGFNLLVTDSGLARLARLIEAARTDGRRLALLDESAASGEPSGR